MLGVGLAILVPAVTTVALNSVGVRHSELASAINNSFSQIAGLLAVVVLGVIMFASFGASLDDRLDGLTLPSDARQQLEDEKLALGAARAPESLDAASRAAVERASTRPSSPVTEWSCWSRRHRPWRVRSAPRC